MCICMYVYPYNMYGTHNKVHNTNIKFVRHFLIRHVLHFYGFPLDLCGKRIAALFGKRAVIFANAPQFEMRHIFTGKALQSLNCDALQDGALLGIASKHGARYAVLISAAAARLFILFDVYRIDSIHQKERNTN